MGLSLLYGVINAKQLKTTKVYTYDAHGKQLNSYAINTPDSVVVPMTP